MSFENEHETNEQFIARIMSFGCPTGPLIQAFIIQALRTYGGAGRVAGFAIAMRRIVEGDGDMAKDRTQPQVRRLWQEEVRQR